MHLYHDCMVCLGRPDSRLLCCVPIVRQCFSKPVIAFKSGFLLCSHINFCTTSPWLWDPTAEGLALQCSSWFFILPEWFLSLPLLQLSLARCAGHANCTFRAVHNIRTGIHTKLHVSKCMEHWLHVWSCNSYFCRLRVLREVWNFLMLPPQRCRNWTHQLIAS